MAEQLTPQQNMAVTNRGGKLLVSAAAGSGKTKVLVDRLMSYLTDPAAPANLDDFLIITYTRPAASELRGKIAAKLSERIAAEPENRHMQRQMQRLYLAKISTVHSFCTDLLRENAYRLDIPADFRVADESECLEMRNLAVERVLENAYRSIGQSESFRTFIDSQGFGRNDRKVPEIILKVYDSARCHLDPEKWLDTCIANTEVRELRDASESVFGRFLMEDLFVWLDRQIDALEACRTQGDGAEGWEKPDAVIADAVYQLRALRESKTWDAVIASKNVSFQRLDYRKKDPHGREVYEKTKVIWNVCKDGLKSKLRLFANPTAMMLQDMRQSAAAAGSLVELVRQFTAEYDRMKRSRRVLDFSDLEHKTLDLLIGKRRGGTTALAFEIGERFREIMVDEYQDSNEVQDAIFSALTEKRQNCFMVGDVKQSIYQFRLADPGIFLRKYQTYLPAENAAEKEGRKVLLSHNFRSGGGVLEAANHVFSVCMSPQVGGLHYGEEEALREGIPHEPLNEPEVEFYTMRVREETYPEEAEFTALRILELLDGTHFVRSKDGLRPIAPEDITILLRSPGSTGIYFQKALERHGIRCAFGDGGDLLQTEEIGFLRSLLQTISNPQQDIPLLGTLMSPVFGFTADDLAVIRAGKRDGSVYDALCASDDPKCRRFVEDLSAFRAEGRRNTLTQLLERIYERLRLEGFYAAMPGGEVRSSNLQLFYQLTSNFESAGRRDLEQFLDHLQAMEEKGIRAGSVQTGAGCVSITSIHKSKGLEYPVVFLCGLSKRFNTEDLRVQVMCDKELGLGLSVVDQKNRLYYPTMAKSAMAVKARRDLVSEELRVLYVAMTRARDRLIMIYSDKKPEDRVCSFAPCLDLCAPELLAGGVSCPGEWVLMSALRRTEAGELFNLGGKPEETSASDYPWLIRVVDAPAISLEAASEAEEKPTVSGETVERIAQSLSFRYPHEAATAAPSKQTATQLKGRAKDDEAAEFAPEPMSPKRKWRKPSFVETEADGKMYGNAIHAAMHFIRYCACGSVDAVREEVTRMVRERFLSEEQGQMVDCEKIAAFFATPLGSRIRCGKNVLREFKFTILNDGSEADPSLAGEQILLQGVVDCALVEDDGITVLDFKTDHVTPNSIDLAAERYRPQVQSYAKALTRIYGKPVKSVFLYFFHMNRMYEL